MDVRVLPQPLDPAEIRLSDDLERTEFQTRGRSCLHGGHAPVMVRLVHLPTGITTRTEHESQVQAFADAARWMHAELLGRRTLGIDATRVHVHSEEIGALLGISDIV